jgi:Secretion system C-terminal sorting domain/Right handed beta helix region
MKVTTTLLCILISLTARSTNYYISATGSDAATGTSATAPWATFSNLYALTLAAGDSVLLHGGDTLSGNLYFSPSEYGLPGSPIVVTSYGGGRATVYAGNYYGVFAYNTAGYVIANLNFTGSDTVHNTYAGIYFYADTPGSAKLSGIVIDSVSVTRFHNSGIYLFSWPKDSSKTGYNDVRITNATCYENAGGGITMQGYAPNSYSALADATDTLYSFGNLYIGHCSLYSNPGGSGIVIGQVDSGVIEYCEAYNNGAGAGGPVGIWAWDCKGITIQHCESHHNHTSGSDGDGFDLDGGTRNCIMQYNYAHDNDGAGYLVWQYNGARPYHDNIVRYNISENDSRAHSGYYGIVALGMGDTTVNSGIHHVDIYNNTFYKNRIAGTEANQGAAISVDGWNITDVRVMNNIFVLDSNARFVTIYDGADVHFYNNDYYSNWFFWAATPYADYYSAEAWSDSTGQETLGGATRYHLEDPLLIRAGGEGTIGDPTLLAADSSYRVRATSPMLDSAINLMTEFGIGIGARDYFGDSTYTVPGLDIGACECNPHCTLAAMIMGDSAICAGSTLSLSDSVAGGYWYSNNASVATISTSGMVAAIADGADTLAYIVPSFCGNDTASKYLTVYPTPHAAISEAGEQLVTDSGYATYQWLSGGVPITGATGHTYMPDSSGTYSVAVGNANGCTDTSVAAYVFVLSLGTSQQQVGSGIRVYPNPTHGTVIISGVNPPNITVRNAQGEVVGSYTHANTVDLSGFPPGIYTVEVRDEQPQLLKLERVVRY